ncbi:MAG: sodium-dependent transporter [Bacteroidota bacterium]
MNSRTSIFSGINTKLLVVAIGSAVGLGNIWKFPYITSTQGGGAFVIIYLLAILLIGLPLLVSELILGDRLQKGLVQPKTSLSRTHLQWVKLLGGMVAFLILSFYSVVAGWSVAYCIEYIKAVLFSSYLPLPFDSFSDNPYPQAGYHMLIILVSVFVVGKGINTMERVVKVMLMLFVVLLVLLSLGSMFVFEEQMPKVGKFLFSVDSWKIGSQGILEAVGHAFFTLSLASGIILIFGQNFTPDKQILKSSVMIAIADTMIALMACLLIFPIIFAMKGGTEFSDNSGILFTAINELLSNNPYGRPIGALFFLLVSFAALTSVFSVLHAVASIFQKPIRPLLIRIKPPGKEDSPFSYHFLSTVIMGGLVMIVGLFCAVSNSSKSSFSDIGTGAIIQKKELRKSYLQLEQVKDFLSFSTPEELTELLVDRSYQEDILQQLGKDPEEVEQYEFVVIPSLNELEVTHHKMKEVKSFMDLCIHVSTNWLLPVSGLVLSLFVGYFLKDRDKIPYFGSTHRVVYFCWKYLVRLFAPLVILGILVMSLIL